MVKQWEHFNDSKMGIVVRNIRRSGLPDNVFDAGERPQKLAQKRGKGMGKSNDISPHKPAKKPRSSTTTPEVPFRSTTTANGSTSTPVSLAAESYSKDLNVKSPQLPYGENVAVATRPVGAS
ncbi:hypothetical protein C0993_010807 [Termitomyces sp. T159_Od127]|nr:hypothetical protein C0993_010807 [Termitomyces sp. T159_Od127]